MGTTVIYESSSVNVEQGMLKDSKAPTKYFQDIIFLLTLK
jgi:hypothetical protein